MPLYHSERYGATFEKVFPEPFPNNTIKVMLLIRRNGLNLNNIIIRENSYYFYNNSYLAYFVAKSLNSRYNNNENNGELELILKNICFNINGDILLFLSYITSNLSLLRFIIYQAEEHIMDWKEFYLDKRNIGFLFRAECPKMNLPTPIDRKKKDRREENYERKALQQDKIERLSLL